MRGVERKMDASSNNLAPNASVSQPGSAATGKSVKVPGANDGSRDTSSPRGSRTVRAIPARATFRSTLRRHTRAACPMRSRSVAGTGACIASRNSFHRARGARSAPLCRAETRARPVGPKNRAHWSSRIAIRQEGNSSLVIIQFRRMALAVEKSEAFNPVDVSPRGPRL